MTDTNSNKCRRGTEPLPEDFLLIGKDIHNKSGRGIRSSLTEERTFREFFGTTKVVVAKLWDLLLQWQMIPEDGTTNHIMWALFFMRAYPKVRQRKPSLAQQLVVRGVPLTPKLYKNTSGRSSARLLDSNQRW